MWIVVATTDATAVGSVPGMDWTGDGWEGRGRRGWAGRRTVLKT